MTNLQHSLISRMSVLRLSKGHSGLAPAYGGFVSLWMQSSRYQGRMAGRGFIKGRAAGKLTGREDGFAHLVWQSGESLSHNEVHFKKVLPAYENQLPSCWKRSWNPWVACFVCFEKLLMKKIWSLERISPFERLDSGFCSIWNLSQSSSTDEAY